MKDAFRLGAIILTCCVGSLMPAAELTGANAEVVVAPDAPPATPACAWMRRGSPARMDRSR